MQYPPLPEDIDVLNLIAAEEARQLAGLELIPSENYASDAVRNAMASVFANKYSEGYPGKRYYGGQENTDSLEQLAIDRAKTLFHADHANVQPHSGAAANEAVYNAWLQPGDTILAMDLTHGGHLTHGAAVTRSGALYNFVRYGMKDITTGELDYDHIRDLAVQYKPKLIIAGFSAYPRTLDYERFAAIGNEVGALLLADVAHIAGFIAAGLMENPLDHGFHVLTTTTHKSLRGPRGGMILSKGTVSSPLSAPEKTIENIPTLIDRSVFPGTQGGPHMNSIAAKAVMLHEADSDAFRQYAVRALEASKELEHVFKEAGIVMIAGGTDNHLICIDVMASFGIDGKVAQESLDTIGLTVNANNIPDDPLPPYRPSGIRLGTPALATRGLDTAAVSELGRIIVDCLRAVSDTSIERQQVDLKARVSALLQD